MYAFVMEGQPGSFLFVSLENLVGLAYGVIGGALVAVVALRTRLALMQRDTKELRRSVAALEYDIDQRLKLLDRRSVHALKIMADVARKVGVDSRFSDQVLRMIADERGAAAEREREREREAEPDDN